MLLIRSKPSRLMSLSQKHHERLPIQLNRALSQLSSPYQLLPHQRQAPLSLLRRHRQVPPASMTTLWSGRDRLTPDSKRSRLRSPQQLRPLQLHPLQRQWLSHRLLLPSRRRRCQPRQ